MVEIVVEALQRDLVSIGELEQMARDLVGDGADRQDCVVDAIRTLLTDCAEIGLAVNEGGYVKFIAWKGEVDARIERAVTAQQNASELDRAFAFWLCLRVNVDAFEESMAN